MKFLNMICPKCLNRTKYNRNLNAEFACRKPTGASWLRRGCRRQIELLQVEENVGSFMSSRRLAKKGQEKKDLPSTFYLD